MIKDTFLCGKTCQLIKCLSGKLEDPVWDPLLPTQKNGPQQNKISTEEMETSKSLKVTGQSETYPNWAASGPVRTPVSGQKMEVN